MVCIGEAKAKFRKTIVFNDSVLAIMAEHKNMVSLELIEGDEVLVSIPVYYNEETEEHIFPSSLFSFVDYRWFTNDASLFKKFQEQAWENGYNIDVVGLTGGVNADVGIGFVPCRGLQDFALCFDTKMQKKLRRVEKHHQHLSYVESYIWAVENHIRKWFERYNNPDIELAIDLYQYWEFHGALKAMAVMEHGEIIACDILLMQDYILCGLLTPWDKDNEHLRQLSIGWYVIVQASNYGNEHGLTWFSLGDTLMEYKKKFIKKVVPSYYIGLGRRELRDE